MHDNIIAFDAGPLAEAAVALAMATGVADQVQERPHLFHPSRTVVELRISDHAMGSSHRAVIDLLHAVGTSGQVGGASMFGLQKWRGTDAAPLIARLVDVAMGIDQ